MNKQKKLGCFLTVVIAAVYLLGKAEKKKGKKKPESP